MTYSMTDEQRFIFDLKGWLLIPSVLQPDEIREIKEFLDALQFNPESLPERERHVCGGASSQLLDHPVIVGVLNEIIASRQKSRDRDVPPESGEEPKVYGFRCDAWNLTRRTYDPTRSASDPPPSPPHNGGVEMFPTHSFRVFNGSITSPVTRVVWELNPVKKWMGGTLFMSGSHKSNFPIPPEHRQIDSPLFETYGCPAGSVLFFTESICHGGPQWLDPENDRMALFFHYMHASAKWHYGAPPHETVMAMPPKRRTLFRGVWIGVGQTNDEYSNENRAI
jgi:hypothetical protein